MLMIPCKEKKKVELRIIYSVLSFKKYVCDMHGKALVKTRTTIHCKW